jgi:DNA-binding protein H-NS
MKRTIQQQLALLQKKKDALIKQENELNSKLKPSALKQIAHLVKAYNISPQEIQKAVRDYKPEPKPSHKKSFPKPKYFNPANKSQVWTGRGRTPEWAKEFKAAGTLYQYLIQG